MSINVTGERDLGYLFDRCSAQRRVPPPRVPLADIRTSGLLWDKQGALTTELRHKSLPPPILIYQITNEQNQLRWPSGTFELNNLPPVALSTLHECSHFTTETLWFYPPPPLTQHLRETHMRPHDLWFSVPTTMVAAKTTIFTKTNANIKLRVSETFGYVREKNNARKYYVKCWKCENSTNFSEENGSEPMRSIS